MAKKGKTTVIEVPFSSIDEFIRTHVLTQDSPIIYMEGLIANLSPRNVAYATNEFFEEIQSFFITYGGDKDTIHEVLERNGILDEIRKTPELMNAISEKVQKIIRL